MVVEVGDAGRNLLALSPISIPLVSLALLPFQLPSLLAEQRHQL